MIVFDFMDDVLMRDIALLIACSLKQCIKRFDLCNLYLGTSLIEVGWESLYLVSA